MASTLDPDVAGGLGKPANYKSILSGLGIEFLQTRLGAEKSVSLSIRLNALRPTDRLERDWKFFEAVAVQVVEAEASAGQQRTIGSFAKCGRRGDGNSLCGPKSLEAIAVVAEDAVFRAHPNEAFAVFVYLPHRKVCQTICVPEGAETVLLGKKSPCREQQDGQRARDFWAAHKPIISSILFNLLA